MIIDILDKMGYNNIKWYHLVAYNCSKPVVKFYTGLTVDELSNTISNLERNNEELLEDDTVVMVDDNLWYNYVDGPDFKGWIPVQRPDVPFEVKERIKNGRKE